MNTSAITLIQCGYNLLLIPSAAAASLPLILGLGLVAGRRGNAAFCIEGAGLAAKFNLFLSIWGIVAISGGYALQIFTLGGADYWGPLFVPAGRPWLASLILWLLGMLFLSAAAACLMKFRGRCKNFFPDDRYRLSEVGAPFWLFLFSAFAFLLSGIALSWPFSGLPSGLGWDRALMAIVRNGISHYFMAFAPGGCLALLWAFRHRRGSSAGHLPAGGEQFRGALRWFAVFALAGYLPYSLQNGGLALGMLFGGQLVGRNMSNLGPVLLGLCFIIAFMACFVAIVIEKKPEKRPWLGWLGLFFLSLNACAPKLYQMLAGF